MATASQEPGTNRAASAFVVLNPKSGGCDANEACAALERHLAVAGVACRVHEPSHSGPLREHVREAVRAGCDLVVAAGGDGTVSGVVDALAGSETPLGIVPLGTANVLAGELGVPTDLEGACRVLAGAHALARIDAMELGGRRYVTQVGVGLDAAMIRDTSARKRRFGRVAYVWTAATRLVGLQPRRFTLTVDGVATRPRAVQVLVANCGTLGRRPFRWGPTSAPATAGSTSASSGRPHTLLDFAVLGWHFVLGRHRQAPDVSYRTASREVTIDTATPMPVQADGEIVGATPVTVRIVPGAVRVAVPAGVRGT